jgi:uncharacterized MAPEG superfamily protein
MRHRRDAVFVPGRDSMSIELKLLIWSAVLAFAQMLVAVTGAFLQVGLPTLAGNRENMPVMPGWVGRAERAHYNMLENLLLFAILVLAAQVTSKLNGTTAMGAQLFFWARLAYALIYVGGLPWIRTGAWAVSVIGLLLIFFQLM